MPICKEHIHLAKMIRTGQSSIALLSNKNELLGNLDVMHKVEVQVVCLEAYLHSQP